MSTLLARSNWSNMALVAMLALLPVVCVVQAARSNDITCEAGTLPELSSPLQSGNSPHLD